ncbi:MAG: hypothetical protein A2W91_04245 [Bacteroidetes bacterium GWF2_38_335]|nr:MAG: hypothetical protein A2W91_04245 [Bacteroidetes bacterium GWF2_38_335]HBS88752.1 hypothetical protein [Bacteroidales bacterium]
MKKTNFILMLLIGVVVVLSSCKKDKDDDDDDPIVPQTITVNGEINTNVTWLAENTYLVDGSLDVDNGGVLTIEPGTTIKFTAGSCITVGYNAAGTIIANGTAEKPITFTSSAAMPTAGAWSGIRCYDNTQSGTIFNYCNVKYSGGDEYYGSFHIANCKVTLTNSTFTNNAGNYTIFMYDGTASDGFASFTGNTITGNTGHAIKLPINFATQLSESNTISCSTGKGIYVSGNYNLADATIKNINIPYYIGDSENIELTGKMNVAPGVTFKFGSNATLSVGYDASGFLNAAGTAAMPIIFTTSVSTPDPGAWYGIVFRENAHSGCNLTYCNVSFGGHDTYYSGNVSIENCDVTIKNSTISNSENYGITLRGTGALSAESTGNTFTGNAAGDVGTNP